MRRIKKIICLLALLFILAGCFDILTGEQQVLLNNLSVVNPKDQDDSLFSLIMYNGSYNMNVIEDHILEAKGNDTVLFVKGASRRKCEPMFYRISHDNGNKILNIVELNEEQYRGFTTNFKPDFSFFSELTCQ